VLMKRLGYSRYVAQGGDWGALITEQMALLAPPELIAIHSNMPGTLPPEIVNALAAGSPPPADLGTDEKHAYEQVAFFYKFGLGYANEMALRPQTLYGIVDSPAGLASWILDHDADSYALIARSFDGEPEGLSRDDILDNITFYWLTNTAVSSARLYWEHRRTATAGFFDAKGVTIPVGVSAYPSEIYTAPKSWTERAFPKLLHYGRLPKGCHFAAWEQPKYFTDEVRASFKTLRT
jgi:pimeloyl-ACP methyl ester carboxylesterase